MTRQEIDAVLDRVKAWPQYRQADLARMALEIERQGTDVYVLDADEQKAVEEALAEAERGEFATDEEVEAVFARYRG